MVSDGDHSLFIPLKVSGEPGESVEIFLSEISEISADDIVSTLKNENATPKLYLDFALAYAKINDLESYRDILEAGVDVDAPECDTTDVQGVEIRTSKMRIYCALATTKIQEAAAMAKSVQSGDQKVMKLKVDELYSEANDLFDLSDRINQFWPVTWCCKGVMFLQKYELDGTNESKKNLDRAAYYFDSAMKDGSMGKSLPCFLGRGAVCYLEGDYKKAERHYSDAIKFFPEASGPPARVALGLAAYKLGQIDRAKACFDRAIEMDGGITEAVVGRSVLDLASADDTTEEGRTKIENAIKMIVTAPLHDNNNAMVKNHLANHFFYVYTAIPGTVSVDEKGNGSSLICSQSMDLRAGDRIRVGLDFETSVESKNGNSITVSSPFRTTPSSPKNLTVYKHDYDRVLAFAKAGFHATKVAAIRAESCWLMGRVYQVQGEYDNAEKFYHQSVKLDPSFSPALFSYSQILVRKKDYFAAVECLNKVLTTTPDSPDTLSLLGFILAKDVNKRAKALDKLQRAIELNPREPRIHLMYATVLRGNVVDFARSLEAYGNSMSYETDKVCPSTYNNVGVLNAWKSSFDEAEDKYIAAIEHLTGIKLEGPEALGTITRILESGKEHAVTIIFNLARLYEEKRAYEKAANIQKTIIKSLPAYTSSYVRLATIARDMGASKQCTEWLNQALEVSTDNSELLSMIGHFWLEDGEYEMGQKIYERLLDEGQSFMEPYAQISLGNIYFSNVSNNPERAGRLIDFATMYYKKALKSDPSNVFAASGLGCVLAEMGKVEQSKDVFQRVRECSNDSIDATFLNLGHVLLALGQHAPAVALYNKYSESKQHGDSSVLGYLAHAHYSWAKHSEYSSDPSEGAKVDERYTKALEYLEKSKAESDNLDTIFNLALLKMDFASAVNVKRDKNLKRTVADVQKAKVHLEEALHIFEELSKMGKTKGVHFKLQKCNDFITRCKSAIEDTDAHIKWEEDKEKYDADKREEQRLKAEAAADARKIKQLEEEEAAAKERELHESLAKENALKAQELSEELKYGLGASGAGKKKKKGSDMMDDDSDDDDGVVAGGEVERSAGNDAADAVPSNNDLFGDDTSDEEDFEGGGVGEGGGATSMEIDKEAEAAVTTKDTVNKLFEDTDSDEDEVGGGGEAAIVEEQEQEQWGKQPGGRRRRRESQKQRRGKSWRTRMNRKGGRGGR